MGVMCECNSSDCMANVPIADADYMRATVRSNGIMAYVVVPEHVATSDKVVETCKDYVVVR